MFVKPSSFLNLNLVIGFRLTFKSYNALIIAMPALGNWFALWLSCWTGRLQKGEISGFQETGLSLQMGFLLVVVREACDAKTKNR